MEFKALLAILLSTIFINNYVLSKTVGMCSFLGVTKKLDSAWGMGMAVTFVMTLSSFITHIMYKYVLYRFHIEFLRTVAFIIVIASLVQIVEMIITKSSPLLYHKLGIFLPLITTNCAVLAVTVLNIDSGFISDENGLIKSVVQGFGGGAGFTIALLFMAGIRERLELSDIPENLKGLPITFITGGLMALAFLGFAGMKII